MCQLNNMETLFTVTPSILKRLNVTHYYAFVYFWSHLQAGSFDELSFFPTSWTAVFSQVWRRPIFDPSNEYTKMVKKHPFCDWYQEHISISLFIQSATDQIQKIRIETAVLPDHSQKMNWTELPKLHGKRGGGTAIYVHNSIPYKHRPDLSAENIESSWVQVNRLKCKKLHRKYWTIPNLGDYNSQLS